MIKKYTRQWMLSARESERLSLQRLAEIAGLAYPSLQKIETGKTVNIKPQTLEKIAKALHLLPEDAVMMENEYKERIHGKTDEPALFPVWLDPMEVKDGKVTVDGVEYRVELPVANGKILLNLDKE
jgi:DNA-binding helix-turn-helix protein